MKKQLCFAAVIGCALLLVSCANQPAPDTFDAPGFFSGFWNGFTIFFSLIGHLFSDSIRIYAFPNSGGWYDFGYFLGVSSICAMIFGGGTAAAN